MTKNEVIEREWIDSIGEKIYAILKNHIDLNGCCKMDWFSVHSGFDKFPNETFDEVKVSPFYHSAARPKSLSGIDYNNKWTVIESESDLPKEETKCYFIHNQQILEGYFNRGFRSNCRHFGWGTISHYQPIQKPNPPLY